MCCALQNVVIAEAASASVCGRAINSALSRPQLIDRTKKAAEGLNLNSGFNALKALGPTQDGYILFRMPARPTVYADTGTPTFNPSTESCELPEPSLDHLMLGVKSIGRGALAECLFVARRGESLAPYEAVSPFGAAVKVSRTKFVNFKIFMGYYNPRSFMQEAAPSFYPTPSDVSPWSVSQQDDPWRWQMTKTQLESWRRDGDLYFLLKLRSPYAQFSFGGHAATLSAPRQEERYDYFLIADVECIALVNRRTSVVRKEMLLPMTAVQGMMRR
jgi:hypothetical protein